MRVLLSIATVLAACTVDVNIDKNTRIDAAPEDSRGPDIADASPSLDATPIDAAILSDASPSFDAAIPSDASPSLDAAL